MKTFFHTDFAFLDFQGFSALFKLQPYNVFGVGDITAAPVYEYAFPKIRSYAPKVKFDDQDLTKTPPINKANPTVAEKVNFKGVIDDPDADLSHFSLASRKSDEVEVVQYSQVLANNIKYTYCVETSFAVAGTYLVMARARDQKGRTGEAILEVTVDPAAGQVATSIANPRGGPIPAPVVVEITTTTAGVR